MKKSFYLLLCTIAASMGLISCEEGSVGQSISQSLVDVVVDSSFTVTGNSVISERVQSRTTRQLLGVVKADNYGELRSDYVTQFMPALALDTVGVTENEIDSVSLYLRYPLGGYVGDSIVPMRVNVYRLKKQLSSPIYSNFDPAEYYSEEDLLGTATYTATAKGLEDSLVELMNTNDYRQIRVKMPLSLGKDIFREYKKNPSTFATPEAFAKFFPGIYVKNSYGNGRVVNLESTAMTFFYRKNLTEDGVDTTYYNYGEYLATTPEVVTNSNITLKVADSVKDMISSGHAIVQSPSGYDVAIKFPTQQIVDKYKEAIGKNLGVLNNVYFEVPVKELEDDYGITPPPYLLLVKASEKEKFFADNMVTNDISSYYAAYNASTKTYVFNEMRDFIINILKEKNGVADAEDINLMLIPVTIDSETDSYYGSTTITGVYPYVDGPAIAKLDLENAKVKITISKQTIGY